MNSGDVTQLLDRVNRGEPEAFSLLIGAVYAELRQIAGSLMSRQREGQTLQPTALVHEAWLNLIGHQQRWDGRAHFFGAAARAMRQVLIAHARGRAAQKRAGGCVRVTFTDLQVQVSEPDVDLLALDQALSTLARIDEHLAQIMELRYFCGLTLTEISELKDRSLASVKRDWLQARHWLADFLKVR